MRTQQSNVSRDNRRMRREEARKASFKKIREQLERQPPVKKLREQKTKTEWKTFQQQFKKRQELERRTIEEVKTTRRKKQEEEARWERRVEAALQQANEMLRRRRETKRKQEAIEAWKEELRNKYLCWFYFTFGKYPLLCRNHAIKKATITMRENIITRRPYMYQYMLILVSQICPSCWLLTPVFLEPIVGRVREKKF